MVYRVPTVLLTSSIKCNLSHNLLAAPQHFLDVSFSQADCIACHPNGTRRAAKRRNRAPWRAPGGINISLIQKNPATMCFLGSCNRFFIGIKHLQGLDQFFFRPNQWVVNSFEQMIKWSLEVINPKSSIAGHAKNDIESHLLVRIPVLENILHF